MEIRRLEPEEIQLAVEPCAEPDWRERLKRGMEARRRWLLDRINQGLRVLVALERLSSGERISVGILEYLPIEISPLPVEGKGLLFIDCIWVIPPFWRRGVATELMRTLIGEAKNGGGMAVLAYEGDQWFGFFDYMPAWFFKKFDFKEVDREGSRLLLYRGFGEATPPHLIQSKLEVKQAKGGGELLLFWNSQCPWSARMVDVVGNKLKTFPQVSLRIINTDKREAVERYGLARGVILDGKPVFKRMASWEEIKRVLARELGVKGG